VAKQPSDELKQSLRTQLERYRWYAMDFMTAAMTAEARTAWEYYYGDLPTPVTAGGSSWVDRTVWESVNGTLQDLLNVFTSGEDAVRFASVDERDADAAKLATQVVNQILLRDNDGYNVLSSALKECLVTRNSFIKRYWSEEDRAMTEKVEGVNPDELQAYIQGLEDGGIEKLEVVGVERDDGLIDADISYVLKIKKVKVEYVPLEEILVDQWCTNSIQDATYFAHRTRKTKKELLDLGFPEDEIDQITWWNTTEEINQQQMVAWSRTDWRNDWHQDIGTDDDDHQQKVWLYEQYVRTSDLSDDGIVRLYQVFDAGDRILEINEVDDIPFETFTPYPIPGSIFGESVYDITKDIQDLRTALIRGMIDNIHTANYGRYTAIAGAYDVRSLLDNRPGGVVEMERPDAVNLLPYHNLPNGIDALLGMTEDVKEMRTGVTKLGMGINADVFKNDNAYATVGLMMNAAQNRIRMVARNIAHNGMSSLMRAIYRLFRENSQLPLTVQTQQGIIQVHPRQLPPRNQLVISVAISPSEKQQRAQNLLMLKQMMMADPQIMPLFGLQQDRYMTSEIFQLMGIQDVHNYIMPLEQYQPQPDPMQQLQLQMAQAQVQKTQNEAQKIFADADNDKHRLAFEQQKAADDTQMKMQDLQFQQEHAADNMQLENRKVDNEATVETMKHNIAMMQHSLNQYKATLQELEINLSAQLESHKIVHDSTQGYQKLHIQDQTMKNQHEMAQETLKQAKVTQRKNSGTKSK
jgi:hypothetical protein